ncbi:MAG: helix-turn-helix domain-containing protein [Lachnoclostridium sp.]
MLSNQVIQKVIQDIKQIAGLECSVWNMKNECLAMTSLVPKALNKKVAAFIKVAEENEVTESVNETESMFLVREEAMPVYVLVILGESKETILPGRFGVSQMSNLLQAYRERMDRNRFMQNLILDNLLLVDIYNQAKKMKIPVEQRRIVFLIEPKNEGDNLVLETLKGLFATGTKDFVTSVDEGHVILIKALENTDSYEQVNHISRMLVDTLNMEAMVGVRVSYGTIVEELKDVSRSYKEADMALEVGRVFYEERNILGYNELGIGRLIHQLPKSLCEMFLQEVFGGNVMEHFEEEELATVYTFFDNNLNISETARQLYVHRNTLVYRLEKIQKKTGLDVRKFDDALMFKIAMMVESHMRYMKGK